MSTSRARAGIFSALALVTLAFSASAQARVVPKSFFGVVPQEPAPYMTTDDFDRMGEGNVGTVRLLFSWSLIDPVSPRGDFNWTAFDPLVADAARNGIVVLPVLFDTPTWVATSLDHYDCYPGCRTYGPTSRAALAAWKAFVKGVMERYGVDGEFWELNPKLEPYPIRVVQGWNEQNSVQYWKPRPNAKAYSKMLAKTHEVVKSVDPGAEVILGGMFGTPLGGRHPGGISAWNYLKRLYEIKGSHKHFEGVALHPYGREVEMVRAQVELSLDEIRAAHDRGVDMWITELGWASGGRKHELNVGKQQQAKNLRKAFDLFLKKRNAWNVRVVTWFSWQDYSKAELCLWCPKSGLFTKKYEPKPSWEAFTRYTGGT